MTKNEKRFILSMAIGLAVRPGSTDGGEVPRHSFSRAAGNVSNLEMWNTDAYRPIIEKLRAHEIPERYPAETIATFENKQGLDEAFMTVRDEIIKASGYAVLTMAWLRPLAEWIGGRRCLEVMAGCGSLSKCLSDLGVDVICTDSYGWEDKATAWFETPWTPVERLDAVSAIRKYGSERDIIICSWPYMDDSCYHALLAMRESNPDALMLYIGEPATHFGAGATADDAFFRVAEPAFDEDFETVAAQYMKCYLLHDRPMLFR